MNALLLIPSKYELKLCPSVKRYERYNEFLYRFFFSGEISVLVGITGIGKLNVAKFFDELDAKAKSQIDMFFSIGTCGLTGNAQNVNIESCDNNTLKKLKKPHNDAQIETAIKNLCDTGIQFGIGFLPFNPYTTIDTLTTDMKFLRRLVNEKFSHPLNICCFANVCTMTEEYSFELAISNLYMKFNIIFDTKVRTQIVSWEKHEHIYPERYTSKSISFDSARLMEELILLCKENQTMNNIKINKVKKSDAQFLYYLMNNESIMTVLNEVPTAINVWADAIIEWGQDSDEEDYIIFDELVPIGWLGINGLSSEDKKAYIKVIALIPSYQKRGIGQYVMNQIIENLKLRGYVSIGLYTDQSNVQAQRCYSKCGFDVANKTVQKMSNGAIVRRYKMELTL